MYMTRQVVTNSKGQKVELFWNFQAFEDIALVPVGHSPIVENSDMHWEIFLWGEPPIKPLIDFDLGVPNTWFEYEEEQWSEQCFVEDALTLPESIRRFPTEKNPNCNRDLWKSQEDLDKIEFMKNPEWTPQNLPYNIYNVDNFVASPNRPEENETRN